MDFFVDRETRLLKDEVSNGNVSLAAEKEIFAHKLLNGMGETMKKQIKEPLKISRFAKFKIKMYKSFHVFMERLSNLKIE